MTHDYVTVLCLIDWTSRYMKSAIKLAQLIQALRPDVLTPAGSYLRRVLIYHVGVVTSAPELPVPVFKLHITKLLIQHQTAFTFQIPHKAGYAHFGQDFHKHMDMICTAFRFQDPHVFPLTQLS